MFPAMKYEVLITGATVINIKYGHKFKKFKIDPSSAYGVAASGPW